MTEAKELVGKVIVGVDDSCCNVLKLKTADGKVYEIVAECGSGAYDVPYLEIYKEDEW